jgi:hypothetical protein
VDDALAAYLDLIGAPPDAATWPDSEFYPALLPPRVYAYLNRHAREQPGRATPARWAPYTTTERHRCYSTAGGGAIAHRALTYTEGIDFTDGDPRPVPHAWTTDPGGGVVELGPYRGDAYFGVQIPTRLYVRCVRDGMARPILPAFD